MDFTGRSPQQPASTGAQYSGGNAPAVNNKKANRGKKGTALRWGGGALGLLVLALVVAIIVAIGISAAKPESSYIDKNKLQAVFLGTGQVYFGNLKTLNSKYLVLTNIYYLQTSSTGSSSSTSSNSNVSLVKLGCELHEPYDQMVINASQVTFWENLQDNGQVAKAVATFQKDNPNGQQCTDQSSAPNTSSNVQNSTSNGTSTTTNSATPTTTTTKH